MTEKRFKMVKSEFTGKYIPVDNNKFYNFCGFEDKWDCINFVRALNDFSKRAITNGKIASKYLEENEQLSDFRDEVFNLIDEKIKRGEKAIEWGESVGADVGAMGFHIEMLRMLKKELFE